jgi:ABC-type transporter Mla MlaB component
MLRITTQNDAQVLTFRLEGRLAGLWVTELRDCWQSCLASCPALVHVDLQSLTFVDTAGKELLGEMHRQGAKLIASDCQMRAVAAQIENCPSTNP